MNRNNALKDVIQMSDNIGIDDALKYLTGLKELCLSEANSWGEISGKPAAEAHKSELENAALLGIALENIHTNSIYNQAVVELIAQNAELIQELRRIRLALGMTLYGSDGEKEWNADDFTVVEHIYNSIQEK